MRTALALVHFSFMAIRRLRLRVGGLGLCLALASASAAGCGLPPVQDAGEYVDIASDKSDAVCPGAALALDALVEYQAALVGVPLDDFHTTLILATRDQIERECGSADARGCVREAGTEVWVGDEAAASRYLAGAFVRQRIGKVDHDFLNAGIAEALSGARTYLPRYSSDGDLPTNLGNLSSRPGLEPLAGNYMAQLLRRDPEKVLQLLRDADDETAGRAETLFREAYGLPLRDDVFDWIGLANEPGCSFGVSACSGFEIQPEALIDWDPRVATCEDGRVFDLGVERAWTTVTLPEARYCSLSGDTQVQVFSCGECSSRQVWSFESIPGQYKRLDDLPVGERVAIQTLQGSGGTLTLSCSW